MNATRPRRGRLARGLLGAWALAAGLALACGGSAPQAIADSEVPGLYSDLRSGDAERIERAARRIEAAEDARFVAPLLELLHASQLGIASQAGYNRRVIAMERLSGESFGADAIAWSRWYADQSLAPPPGFAGFKGAVYGAFDPAYGEILRDDPPPRIAVEAIQWRGIEVGGIPALTDPTFVSAPEADWLDLDEPVLGVALDGDARAYPQRILDWHEIVNDRVAGVPVVLSAGPLSGSAVVFERRHQGRTLSFQASGLLYDSGQLLLDLETRSLWRPLSGEPVLGPLAGEVPLRMLPSVLTSWAEWLHRHPRTRVLSLETGYERRYRPGNPYGSYHASPQLLFPLLALRMDVEPKVRVFGLAADGVARAWPLPELLGRGVVDDEVGGRRLVLVADEGPILVEGESELTGPVRYDAGGAVRAYERGDRRFARGPDERSLVDETGAVWRIGESALEGPHGERLARVAGCLAYWFAWQSVYPETLVYSP